MPVQTEVVRRGIGTWRTAEPVHRGPAILRLTRGAAVVITAAIAISSFVLSFAALFDLAKRSGITPHLAWLWPVTVDGTIVQATTAIVALAGYGDQRRNRTFFWSILVAAALASVCGTPCMP